jgi:hypothetical protein
MPFAGLTLATSMQPGYLLGQAVSVTNAITVVSLGFWFPATAAGMGINAVLALYSDNGNSPLNLIVTTPEFAVAAGNVETDVTPTTITPNKYWVMLEVSAATPITEDRCTCTTSAFVTASEPNTPSPLMSVTTQLDNHENLYVVGRE